MTNEEMVEQFQCPGCVCGGDTKCGRYKPKSDLGGHRCAGHVLGTTIMPAVGHIALGLPKGFNRSGPDETWKSTRNLMNIRLFAHDQPPPAWDRCNVAVWAMERDGFLFVRTYRPRLNVTLVDVVDGGTLALVPQAINVGEFYEEID